MAEITFKGNKIHTIGELPGVGEQSPDFILTSKGMEDKTLSDFKGRKKILNIVPSLDTGVCAASAKTFEARAAAGKLGNTVVITISKDLPFAQKRFCSAEGIENVETLSAFRDEDFGRTYGIDITDGPMRGLLARAVVVLNENNMVIYNQLVPEIAEEPDYDSAVASLT